jgi:GTP cyclohydrolase FolE2
MRDFPEREVGWKMSRKIEAVKAVEEEVKKTRPRRP